MSDAFQTHAAFSWCELVTDNVGEAKKFYVDVIGWEIEEMEMPTGKYTVLKAGGQPVGGIREKSPEESNVPVHWESYITVDDVDQRTDKAKSAGGNVLMPPMDIPGVGRISSIQDTSGGAISLITYEHKEG